MVAWAQVVLDQIARAGIKGFGAMSAIVAAEPAT
jgi:hypothetical protein